MGNEARHLALLNDVIKLGRISDMNSAPEVLDLIEHGLVDPGRENDGGLILTKAGRRYYLFLLDRISNI